MNEEDKNFLDIVPQDWTKPQLKELRDLCVMAYYNPSSARQVAREAGLIQGTFPINQHNMRLTWTALIQEMGRQGHGKLRKMVELAADDPRIAEFRERFLDMLEGEPALKMDNSKELESNWWKGDDQHPKMAAKLYQERLMEKRSRMFNIEVARKVADVSKSIAKLTLKFANSEGYGTGFLIQPDLILTNHHNVVSTRAGELMGLIAEFDYEEDAPEKKIVRQGDISSILGKAEHDWAVVKLTEKVDRSPLALGSAYDVYCNDHLIIVQHPGGGFKQFSIEPLAVRHIDTEKSRIQYVADTQKGSSGSPVFNEQMDVIGLHHAEVEQVIEVDRKKEVVWRNQGIHISTIMKELREHSVPFIQNA